MPNHVASVLTIRGAPDQVDRAEALILNAEGKVDFNLLIPMPPSLAIEATFADGRTEAEESNLRDHGYRNWYDWRCANWGTKWNAYDERITKDPGELELRFDTAWSPPEPWYAGLIQALHDQGINVAVTGVAHDEGWNFWAEYSWAGTVHYHDCDRSAAHVIAYKECYGYEPEPEEED